MLTADLEATSVGIFQLFIVCLINYFLIDCFMGTHTKVLMGQGSKTRLNSMPA